MNSPSTLALADGSLQPVWILLAGIILVVILIAWMRVHAFLSLMLAAVLVGTLTRFTSGQDGNPIIEACKESMSEFGQTAAGIAWIIALAAVIGYCLMESGAADRIVRAMLRLFGEQRAGLAMLASAFVLSIPVFFDTVFYLLVPLAQALAFRMGRQYAYIVVAICSGALITHSLVPPTPGPLIVVESLGLNLGLTILGGIALGILPAFLALRLGRWIDRRMPIELRPGGVVKIEDLKAVAAKPESELPPLWLSNAPVLLPVVLISLASILEEFVGPEHMGAFYPVIEVLGYKHVAMFLGTLIALYLLVRWKGLDRRALWRSLESPLSMAGTIILITSAGGAFGGMIRQSGIGESLTALTGGTGLSMVLLAWLIAAVMKVAQGSSTIAMITCAGIMAGILGAGSAPGFDPFYIFAAIAFGAMFGSWMNDSGFWIVCKMTGFSELETLRTWTISVSVVSLAGLVEVLLVHWAFPYPFG